MSVAVADRLRFMEAVAGDLPHEKLMVGTGATALHDAITLTKAAFSLGFSAALVLPPFYYRDISDAGILQFFDALVRAVEPPEGGVFLYNFPRMSGLTFHAGLVDKLLAAFPGTIGGMKDSFRTISNWSASCARVSPGSRYFPALKSSCRKFCPRTWRGAFPAAFACGPSWPRKPGKSAMARRRCGCGICAARSPSRSYRQCAHAWRRSRRTKRGFVRFRPLANARLNLNDFFNFRHVGADDLFDCALERHI